MPKKKNKQRKSKPIRSTGLVNDRSEIAAEIKELEQRKAKIVAAAKADLEKKKGLKKFGARLGYGSKIKKIDNAIRDRRAYLDNKFKARAIKQNIELQASRWELEKMRAKAIKPISMKDIFGDDF